MVRVIGMTGLLKRTNLEAPDIGFAILPKYERQGYASEMARATLVYAKKKFNLKDVLAITVLENEASINLLTRIGMQFLRTDVSENKEQLLVFINKQNSNDKELIDQLCETFFAIFDNVNRSSVDFELLKSICIPEVRFVKASKDVLEIMDL